MIVIPTVVLLIGAIFIAALLRVLFEPVVFGTAVISTRFCVAGWKLLFRALKGTARDALKVHWIWWAFALLGSVVALTALLKVVLGIHVGSISVDLCLRALAFVL